MPDETSLYLIDGASLKVVLDLLGLARSTLKYPAATKMERQEARKQVGLAKQRLIKSTKLMKRNEENVESA